MKLTLNLTASAASTTAAAAMEDSSETAVLIFGQTAHDWLSPICGCRIPTSELIFLPLSSPGSGELFGAIVAGAGLQGRIQDLQRQVVHESAGTSLPIVTCRCLAGRLFIPADASLSPELTDKELRGLLPVNAAHRLVWHPSVGLIEYEAEDVLSASDLLSGPVQTGRIWNGATPGDQLNLSIRSLQLLQPPEEVFSSLIEGRGDIGSAAGDIDTAPRAPDERPENSPGEVLRVLKLQLAKAVHRITKSLPESPGGSQLLSRLHAWAAGLVQGSGSAGGTSSANTAKGSAGRTAAGDSRSLSTRQENELKRLLHMLEQQPEEGLKYAVPLGAPGSRGTTSPTDRLSRQQPNFDLGKLNASGPASIWEVSPTWHGRLASRYRELALRELRLGNHRRAAYIFAMLLNDLHSAASALEAGRLYRDAAAIYQVHLRQPLQAAECFKRGGLWEEAAAIFRELRLWRQAAELFRLLDRPDHAADMYEQELQELVSKQQWPAAATVAIDFLGDRRRGLQLLRDGWFSGNQRTECLRRLFREHADAGEHQLMEEELQTLLVNDQARLSADQLDIAVIICSEEATKYPSTRVRELLRIHTWQMAAALLARNPALPSQTAVRAIRNLAEQDELLQRDTARCGWKPPRSPGPAVEPRPNDAEIRVQRRTPTTLKVLRSCLDLKLSVPKLPPSVRWQAAAASSSTLFLQGQTASEQLVVARWSLLQLQQGNPRGQCVTFTVFDPRPLGVPRLRLNPLQPEQANLQFFPATPDSAGSFVRQVVRSNGFVTTTALPDALTFDFGFSEDGSRFSLEIAESNRDTVELKLTDRQSNGVVSFPLQLPEQVTESLAESGGRVWLQNTGLLVVSGRFLCLAHLPALQRLDTQAPKPLRLEILTELDSDFRELSPSPSQIVHRVLIATRTSCYVVWLNSANWCRIAEDLQTPHVCWTRNGIAMIASGNQLGCYRVTQKEIRLLASGNLSGQVISLQPDDSPDHVLVLDQSGVLQRFRVPIE